MINTIFYFAPDKSTYDSLMRSNGIHSRTICFVPNGDGTSTGNIYKGGVLYGSVSETVIEQKIRDIIGSIPSGESYDHSWINPRFEGIDSRLNGIDGILAQMQNCCTDVQTRLGVLENKVNDSEGQEPTPTTHTFTVSKSSFSFDSDGNASGSNSFELFYDGQRVNFNDVTISGNSFTTVSKGSSDTTFNVSVSSNTGSNNRSEIVTLTYNGHSVVVVINQSGRTVTPTPGPIIYTLNISSSDGGTVYYNGTSIRNSTRYFDVEDESQVTITFQPDEHYRIKSIKTNGRDITASVRNNTYTIGNFVINTDVEVVFEYVPAECVINIISSGNGSVYYSNTSSDNGTSVRDGFGSTTITNGNNLYLTFVPDSGYKVYSAMVNNIDVVTDIVNNKFTVSNISENTTISVTFAQEEQGPVTPEYYTITYHVGEGVQINTSGLTQVSSSIYTTSIVENGNHRNTAQVGTGYQDLSGYYTVESSSVRNNVWENNVIGNILVRNVTQNVDIYLQASVIPAEPNTYTITYNLEHVYSEKCADAGYNTDVVQYSFVVDEGEHWQDTIDSLHGYAMPSIYITENGVTVTGYHTSGGVINIPSVNANITITANATEVVPNTYTIDYSNITNCHKSSDSPTTAADGSTISITLVPENGYKFTSAPYVAKVGNTTQEAQTWSATSATISNIMVYGDIQVYAHGELIAQDPTLTINATPSDATVSMYYDGSWHTQNTLTLPSSYSGSVNYRVTKTDYQDVTGTWTPSNGSKTVDVTLEFVGLLGEYGTPNATSTDSDVCWDILGYITSSGTQHPVNTDDAGNGTKKTVTITGPIVTQEEFDNITYDFEFSDYNWPSADVQYVRSHSQKVLDGGRLTFVIEVPEYSQPLDAIRNQVDSSTGYAYGTFSGSDRYVRLTASSADGSSTYWDLHQIASYGLGSSSMDSGWETWNLYAPNAYTSIEIFGHSGTQISNPTVQNGYVNVDKSGTDVNTSLWFILHGASNYPTVLCNRENKALSEFSGLVSLGTYSF